jgi:hypothetical protein
MCRTGGIIAALLSLGISAAGQELRDEASRMDWTPWGYRYDHDSAITPNDYLHDSPIYHDDVVYDADLFDNDPFDADGYDRARYGNLVLSGMYATRDPRAVAVEDGFNPGFYEYDERTGEHQYYGIYGPNVYDNVQYKPWRLQSGESTSDLGGQGTFDDDYIADDWVGQGREYDDPAYPISDDYNYYQGWWDRREVAHRNWWGTWDDAGEEGIFDY